MLAELTKSRFRNVAPLALLDPILSAAVLLEMTTWFWDQSAAAVAVAPTTVTVAVPIIVIASEYVPGFIRLQV